MCLGQHCWVYEALSKLRVCDPWRDCSIRPDKQQYSGRVEYGNDGPIYQNHSPYPIDGCIPLVYIRNSTKKFQRELKTWKMRSPLHGNASYTRVQS